MVEIQKYIEGFDEKFPSCKEKSPWDVVKIIPDLVNEKIKSARDEYIVQGNVVIHKNATIEQGVILKGPIFIGENCFVGAHAYLRAGVFADKGVVIGPGCEVKTALLFEKTALAHFNFVGDSILGSNVNMEAGSILANHYNEREHKEISVLIDGKIFKTGSEKFGALVGDHSRIGANAVTSPGTLLLPKSVVGRLELVKQLSE